jgi:hypothetical protein
MEVINTLVSDGKKCSKQDIAEEFNKYFVNDAEKKKD